MLNKNFCNKDNNLSYVQSNDYYVMPVSLTNSIDIVANSVSLYVADTVSNSLDIFLHITDAITQIIGVPLETLNTIQKLADSINNDHKFSKHHKYPIEFKCHRIRCVYKHSNIFVSIRYD